MRGLFSAAAAEKRHRGEAECSDVLDDDCKLYITDLANQTNLCGVAQTDNELPKWRPADARDRCLTPCAATPRVHRPGNQLKSAFSKLDVFLQLHICDGPCLAKWIQQGYRLPSNCPSIVR
jgi:hypothetical protein